MCSVGQMAFKRLLHRIISSYQHILRRLPSYVSGEVLFLMENGVHMIFESGVCHAFERMCTDNFISNNLREKITLYKLFQRYKESTMRRLESYIFTNDSVLEAVSLRLDVRSLCIMVKENGCVFCVLKFDRGIVSQDSEI